MGKIAFNAYFGEEAEFQYYDYRQFFLQIEQRRKLSRYFGAIYHESIILQSVKKQNHLNIEATFEAIHRIALRKTQLKYINFTVLL